MKHLTVDFNYYHEWWKYLLVIVIALFAAQTIGAIPLLIILIPYIVKNPEAAKIIAENPATGIFNLGIDSNLLLALSLIPFAFSLVAIFVLIKPFHKRSYMTLFSGTSSIRWKRFFVGAFIWLILISADLALSYFIDPDNFKFNFNANSFLILFIVSIVLIPIQASTEEIMFRAYMAQGVAAISKNRILVIIIPSVLFGLMHSFNPEIKEYGFWIMMPQYIIIGLLFGLITVLDDGIELAMGAHSINNVFSSLMVTSKASVLQTDAVFFQENIDNVWSLISLIIFSVIFTLVISKIYKFDFSLLKQKISSVE